jgi:CheY-like chemotaxis protein
MAPYFYLSYARADFNQLIKRFFDDLVDTIRIRAGASVHQPIGFYEAKPQATNVEWTTASTEALQTSATLVSLLSPTYFRDERAGREWQIFEMRRRLYVRELLFSKVASVKSLNSPITPVTWLAWRESPPIAVDNLPMFEGSRIVAEEQPVASMLKSMSTSAKTYASFMHTLADAIIERAQSIRLPSLSETPLVKEIHNPFSDLDRMRVPAAAFVERPPVKLFALDSNLLRTLADQMDETSERIGAYTRGTFRQPHDNGEPHRAAANQTPERNQRPMSKYTVWVLDDRKDMVDFIEEVCLLRGYDVETFDQAQSLLDEVKRRSFNNQEMPDLFIIDLMLREGEMQGTELISELSNRYQIRSAILALSAYATDDEMVEAVGAGAVWAVGKFDSADFWQQVDRCAEIGRQRRLFTPDQADPSKISKEVFLSYSAKNENRAKLIRGHLEARRIDVWYAPDVLRLGGEWRKRLREGLNEARVLIAFITPEYLESSKCKAELQIFVHRLQSEVASPPLLIPISYDCDLSSYQQDRLIKECLRYQVFKLRRSTLMEDLMAIHWAVDKFLNLSRYSRN